MPTGGRRWAQFQTVRLKRWWKGRVAVLGDAAHAMPPYLAQGAGHAMMNAMGLAVALDEAPDLEAAFRAWERRERPLTEHTQRWTRIYGNTIFLPRPLKRVSIAAETAHPVDRQAVSARGECGADRLRPHGQELSLRRRSTGS